MIDTIILHLYDLQKYSAIVNVIEKTQTGKGYSTYEQVDEETGELKTYKRLSAIHFHDSDKLMFRTTRTTLTLPSSMYYPSVYVNRKVIPQRIEFNFSIPKFLYGTNMGQFITPYDLSPESLYDKLYKFLEDFCRKSFTVVIDFHDIELNRIDFCYNQYFATKEKALDYLQQQKVIMMAKVLKSGGKPDIYPTSFMWYTKTYSFKVYHKGTEYRKNDLKELAKLKNLKFNPYDVAKQADNVLRYEMTFRNSHLNYFFYRLYRDGSTNVLKRKSIYFHLIKVLNVDKGETPVRKFMLHSKYDDYRELKDAYFKKYPNDTRMNQRWIHEYEREIHVTFTFDVFKSCFNKFWKMAKSYEIETIGNLDTIRERIKKYNYKLQLQNLTKAKTKFVDENSLIYWVHQSSKESLYNYVKQNLLSRPQYYVIIKRFKEIGLGDYNPQLTLANVDWGYSDYKHFFGYLH